MLPLRSLYLMDNDPICSCAREKKADDMRDCFHPQAKHLAPNLDLRGKSARWKSKSVSASVPMVQSKVFYSFVQGYLCAIGYSYRSNPFQRMLYAQFFSSHISVHVILPLFSHQLSHKFYVFLRRTGAGYRSHEMFVGMLRMYVMEVPTILTTYVLLLLILATHDT